MGTTELQTPKRKELSAFASFEIVMSIIAFIGLLLPLVTADFLGTETSFNYFQMNKTFMVWIAYALPIVHILVKLYIRNSWLPLLTSFLTTFFLLGIIIEIGESSGSSSMGYGMSMSLNPAIGYYMVWAAFIGLVISLLVSWTLFLGNKIINYKRWIIISIALIGMSILGFIIGYITNSFALAFLLTEISPIGLIILPGAICSYFIHRKEKGEEDNSKSKQTTSNVFSKVTGNIGEAFQKLPHKKEIAIGALALIAIVAGVSMCGGNDSETSGENKLQTWDKFVKITSDDVNLRKEPDTNSARLMMIEHPIGYTITWNPQEESIYGDDVIKPYHIRKNYVCPVVDETEEWYKINIEDYHAYIMKKFCKEVTPEPIKDKEYQFYNVRKIETDLTGSYLMSSTNYESGEAEVLLKLGYVKNNAYVFNKTIIVDEAERIGKEAFKLYVHPHFEDTRLALPQSYFDGQKVILDKITGKQIEEWFASIKEHNNEVYYCLDGEIFNY